MTTMSTLEVLYVAKARLEGDEAFSFGDFTTCTCGYIYAAAKGVVAETGQSVWGPSIDPMYGEHIMAVARALGWDGERSDEDGPAEPPASWAAGYVSDATRALASHGYSSRVDREHAITVIDQAIMAIEAQQEQDRRDVLAQAATIVDQAAPVSA